MQENILFTEYFSEWIHMYKEGSVRQITMDKYYLTLRELQKRWPLVRLSDINHFKYQQLINDLLTTSVAMLFGFKKRENQ